MTESATIDTATRRLALALDALEVAVERRDEADRSENALFDQVQMLGADRARLASELDAAAARNRRLESANREIAERLDVAIAAIRDVLGENER